MIKLFKHLNFFILCLFVFSLLVGACSQNSLKTTTDEPITLKMAVLPILDTLPMYVAQQEGLFEQNGIQVEFIPVASGAERDQVVSAGQADGMVNEVTSTMLYNKDQTQVQIVRFARTATPEDALFRILASGKSNVETAIDLKGVEIGISQGTVIDYLTDRLLQAEGFSQNEINTIAVPKIPDRMALLENGEIEAAMLPEPLSSLAVLNGAKIVLDDTSHPEYSFSTISFRKEVIDKHPEAIIGFLAAIEEATEEINADTKKWDTLMSDFKLVPPPLLDTFKIPPFVTAGVPDEDQWNDVLSWAKGKGIINIDVSYEESVNPDFLP
ncbi:ABC transporter substrate-binding protein [Chloroflexota bacterium]